MDFRKERGSRLETTEEKERQEEKRKADKETRYSLLVWGDAVGDSPERSKAKYNGEKKETGKKAGHCPHTNMQKGTTPPKTNYKAATPHLLNFIFEYRLLLQAVALGNRSE